MSDNLRYEQKMVTDSHHLGDVRSWVFGHPAAFRVAYPNRQVNNIYFDTLERDLMMDHIIGQAVRSKVRFRWYGESWLAENGQLEIKKKQGRLGTKITTPIPVPVDLTSVNWAAIFDILRTHCTPQLAGVLQNLTPMLINQYQREYYTSADGLVRLTLDYNQRTYDQTFGMRPNSQYLQPFGDQLVVEFKADQSQYAKLTNAIAQFPLRCTQNSKYLNGMEQVF